MNNDYVHACLVMTMIKDSARSNQMRKWASDAVPSAKKIDIHEPEFKFFVSTFRKLEEIIIYFSYACGAIKQP